MVETLKELLIQKACIYSDKVMCRLSSGGYSPYYIDCRMITLTSQGQHLIGTILFNSIKSLGVNGIGGLTMGADPIAIATTTIAGGSGRKDIVSFVVRKEPKKYGLMKYIEGDVKSGDRVIIVDDVLTTGNSILQAIEKAIQYGLKIVKIIVLVDREEGGKENIITKGYELQSLFTKSELFEEYRRKKCD